jgi:4a-hydroxytetrahydrobiopterin dehydratase
MPYADPLTDEDLAAALAVLPEWKRDGDAIERTIACATFTEAIGLVKAVADAAERADHHPDIAVRRYRHVTFRLTTHATRALTRRDIDMAAEIDRHAARIGAP